MGKDARKGRDTVVFQPSKKVNSQVRKRILQQRTNGVKRMNLAMTNQAEIAKHLKMKPLKGDAFSGYMKLMLSGVESAEEVLANTTMAGEWFFKDGRVRIFNKPRKFKLKFYFKSRDNKVLHECMDFLTASDDVVLTHSIVELGNQILSESDLPIDVDNSYVVVRA